MSPTSTPPQRIRDRIGIVLDGAGGPLSSLSDESVIAAFSRHGAVHFVNFATTREDFVAFTDRFSRDFSDYKGGGFRWGSFDRNAAGPDRTVMTTTGGTQGFPIPLHGEFTYMKHTPRVLWFYCETPSPEGGETTLGDGGRFLDGLTDETRRFFEDNRILYRRHLEDGDWQTAFLTDDPDEVRAVCSENDTTAHFDPETGTLSTEYVTSALTPAPDGSRTVFVNNVLPVFMGEWAMESGWAREHLGPMHRDRPPLVVRMEDGSRIPGPIVEDLRRVDADVAVGVPWSSGELVMVDNARIMHGRTEARGEGRSILVRMGQPTFET